MVINSGVAKGPVIQRQTHKTPSILLSQIKLSSSNGIS